MSGQQEQQHRLPPAAEAPSASTIARAFNKHLLKVQILHQLHHESPMELGEATRMMQATADHPDSIQDLLRRLLQRKSSTSSSITSVDISGLLESSVTGGRVPSFLQ